MYRLFYKIILIFYVFLRFFLFFAAFFRTVDEKRPLSTQEKAKYH